MNLNIKDLIGSITVKHILSVIGVLIVVLLIFQAGEFVGYRKASFSYRFGERYYQETFGRSERRPQFMGQMMYNFSETHGATGKIIKISLPTIVLEDKENVERIVTVYDGTLVRQQRNNLKTTDLKLGDTITAIGIPNDQAELEAKLIRLLPTIEPNITQ